MAGHLTLDDLLLAADLIEAAETSSLGSDGNCQVAQEVAPPDCRNHIMTQSGRNKKSSLRFRSAKKCIACGKMFLSTARNCPNGDCPRCFLHSWILTYKRSPADKKSYGCVHCHKVFVNRSHMEAHLLTHQDEPPQVDSLKHKIELFMRYCAKKHPFIFAPQAVDAKGLTVRRVTLTPPKQADASGVVQETLCPGMLIIARLCPEAPGGYKVIEILQRRVRRVEPAADEQGGK